MVVPTTFYIIPYWLEHLAWALKHRLIDTWVLGPPQTGTIETYSSYLTHENVLSRL